MSEMLNDATRAILGYILNAHKDKIDCVIPEIEEIFGGSIIDAVATQELLTYDEVQNTLSKINEKESIRKSKGVYYTPSDVVNFILRNAIYAALNECDECMFMENVNYDEYKEKLIFDKVVFDPTCGAGEFLLAALKFKFELYIDRCDCQKNITKDLKRIVTTIRGNDINDESTAITKARLMLCAIKYFGIESICGLGKELNKSFENVDFVNINPDNHYKCDIIIGNPPYVEDGKSGIELNEKYGNIYANILVNSGRMLNDGGSMGYIIPLSYVSTPRMKKLREELEGIIPNQCILSYSDRPDCLFSSVHQKLCILIGKANTKNKIYTGNYKYWYKEERKNLFKNVCIVENEMQQDDFIPKLGTEEDYSIFKKVLCKSKEQNLQECIKQGEFKIYLNMRAAFWIKAFVNEHLGAEYKTLYFKNAEMRNYVSCILNSSLFWWYWIAISDCWHITGKELKNFRIPNVDSYEVFNELAMNLEQKLEQTKQFVGTKQTEYEYKHKMCFDEISQIDDCINKIFGLDENESSYIKNFAYQYRIGGGPIEKNN